MSADASIRVIFQEGFTFQKCVKMLAENLSDCHLFFSKTEIGIAASNKNETLFVEWDIFPHKLLLYEYNLNDEKSIYVSVSFSELQAAVNSIKKRDSLTISIQRNKECLVVKPNINGAPQEYHVKIQSLGNPQICELNFENSIKVKDLTNKLSNIFSTAKRGGNGSEIVFKALGPELLKVIAYTDGRELSPMEFGNGYTRYRRPDKTTMTLDSSIYTSLVGLKDVGFQSAITFIKFDPEIGLEFEQDCGSYSVLKLIILKRK